MERELREALIETEKLLLKIYAEIDNNHKYYLYLFDVKERCKLNNNLLERLDGQA